MTENEMDKQRIAGPNDYLLRLLDTKDVDSLALHISVLFKNKAVKAVFNAEQSGKAMVMTAGHV